MGRKAVGVRPPGATRSTLRRDGHRQTRHEISLPFAAAEKPLASAPQGDVTRLLDAAAAGSKTAVGRLLNVVYDELRRLAQGCLDHERPDHTLQATALVHEAYLKLVGQNSLGFRSRAAFFGAAATVMRRILVDHARAKRREKRGGDAVKVTLDDALALAEQRADNLPALDEALTALAALDPRKARLVELRFFAGLSMPDAAEMLGIPLRSAERDWTMARAWLRRRLDSGPPSRER